MKRFLLPVLAASALATGCYTQGDVNGGYTYGYAAPAPDLYYLSPGVSVVAYADYPTFYADNYYWMYRDGLWYQSGYYGGGWAVSYSVPTYVRGIDRPYTYTRFQPGQGWTRVGTPGGGGVRDHRTYNGGGYSQPYNGGGARDHRSYGGPSTYTPPPAAPSGRDHRAPTYTPGPSSNPPPVRDNSPGPAAPRQVPSREQPGGVRNHRH